MTLRHSEIEHLRNLLGQYLAVAGESAQGEFLITRIDPSENGSSTITRQLLAVLQRPELLAEVASEDVGGDVLDALKGHVRIREMRNAIESLRNHLEGGDVLENVYQKWFDAHPWVFGNQWVGRDALRSIRVGDQVDGLLPDTITGFRDLLELKRPDHQVLSYDNEHRNWFFHKDASSAIGQCHRYLDTLHSDTGRLEDHPDTRSYHPRAVIVVGRSHEWPSAKVKALHGLNSRLHGLTVMTYDQLLRYGERLLEIVETDEASKS